MDEFAALAQRVVLTMDDVRGCLVLSRDGLVLGAFPEDQEAELKPAWLRFVHVGEARKGFVEFQVCRTDGTAGREVISKKQGQRYRDARDAEWGDLLP